MTMSHRAWIAIAYFCVAIIPSALADPPQTLDVSPEIVYVSAQPGQLHSGPGEDFYPTGRVDQNASLEVYYQTHDGWLGVRPPEGSFSWVQAADAYLLPGGRMIEVTGTAAVSWIGTSLGSAKQYRWQVKLRPGEQLGVLGEQTTQQGDGQEVLWYKIAPPAGEFRWIEAKSVSPQPVSSTTAASPQTMAKKKRGAVTPHNSAAVTTAAYQTAPGNEVVTLGSSDGYLDDNISSSEPFIVEGSYPRAPQPGEIVNGEVVVGNEFAPGQIIERHNLPDNSSEAEYVGGESFDANQDSQYYGDGQYHDGVYSEGEFIDGEIVSDGNFYDGHEVEDGEVIYDSGDYIDGVVQSSTNKPFDGWHAIELNDDGMRFTWLERLYGRAKQQGPDPLQADPFSLAMQKGQVRPNSPRAVEQMYPQGIPQGNYASSDPANRRHRPWRDPRTLGKGLSNIESSPSSAPELSSLEKTGLPPPLNSDRTPPLTPGLQRLGDVLQGQAESLLPCQTAAKDSSTSNVNWYGIGQSSVATGGTNSSPGHQSISNVSTVSTVSTTPNQAIAASNLGLNQLQLNLSEAVTQPMQLWSLQPIYDSAKNYVEHGATAIERGQARLLMERIEEFAELAARSGYLALNRQSISASGATAPVNTGIGPTSSVMLASTSSSTLGTVVRSDFDRAMGGSSSYDATGWLVPVIAASSGQPAYALTDDTGRIQAYVSPVPGLNLDRYLNQAVGVTGLRGYLPQLQAGHIQVSRVVRVQ